MNNEKQEEAQRNVGNYTDTKKPMTENEKKILNDKILTKDKALLDKTNINK